MLIETEAVFVPPGPVQVMVYDVLDVNAGVTQVPLNAIVAHGAVQDVAFVEDHVNVEVALGAMDVGLAVNVTVGAVEPLDVVIDLEAEAVDLLPAES